MLNIARRFLLVTTGAVATEYALIAVIIVLALMASLPLLTPELADAFEAVKAGFETRDDPSPPT